MALWFRQALYPETKLSHSRTDRQSNSATTFLVRPRSISRWAWSWGWKQHVGVGNPDPQLQLISPKVTFVYRGKRRAATAIGKLLGLCAHPNPIAISYSVYSIALFRLEINQHCLTNNLFATYRKAKLKR